MRQWRQEFSCQSQGSRSISGPRVWSQVVRIAVLMPILPNITEQFTIRFLFFFVPSKWSTPLWLGLVSLTGKVCWDTLVGFRVNHVMQLLKRVYFSMFADYAWFSCCSVLLCFSRFLLLEAVELSLMPLVFVIKKRKVLYNFSFSTNIIYSVCFFLAIG